MAIDAAFDHKTRSNTKMLQIEGTSQNSAECMKNRAVEETCGGTINKHLMSTDQKFPVDEIKIQRKDRGSSFNLPLG